MEDSLKNKIENFLDKISNWREKQEYLLLNELIWHIYNETDYYNYVGLMPNGKLRQANLKMLLEKAKDYENASFHGLFHFLQFIEKMKANSNDMGAAKVIGGKYGYKRTKTGKWSDDISISDYNRTK